MAATPCPERAGRCAALRDHLLPLAGYGALTIALTYPLALHWRTRLPGNDHDAWQNVWNFRWVRQALGRGQWPWHTDLLYAPDGAPLYLHTLNILNGILSLPVQLALGPIAAYNAVVFCSFTLAAYFAYLLVRFVTGSAAAGVVGGCIYGFSGYQFGHYFLGQTNLLASEWLPAFVLCLLAADAACGPRRLLLAGAGACSLLLLLLCDWHYVAFALAFAAWYAVVRAAACRTVAPLAVAAGIAAGGTLLMLPVLLPTIIETRSRAIPLAAPATIQENSADLLSLVIPDSRQVWWGAVAPRLGWQEATATYDRVAFLGYLPLALAAYGWWAARRRGHFWGWTAILFALLALGPTLQVAGATRFLGLPWPIPLPYRLLHALPGLAIARVPSRFALVTILALAVLAGFGVACLARRAAVLRRAPARVALVALLLVGLLGEQLRVPVPLTPFAQPAYLAFLARAGAPGTILDIPYYPEDTLSLRYQTIHRQSIVGGYLSRDLDYPLLSLPPFPSLLHQPIPPDIVAGEPPDLALATLAAANVRWVVVNLGLIPPGQPRLAPELAAALETTPAYEDADFAVYRPLPLPNPQSPRLAVVPARGWDEPEQLASGERRMRWFAREADLDLWNLGTIEQRATLRFAAASFHRPRELRVSVDGREVGHYRIEGWQSLAVPVAVGPGWHRVTLATPDAPTRPVDVRIGTDPRALAISVADVTVGP